MKIEAYSIEQSKSFYSYNKLMKTELHLFHFGSGGAYQTIGYFCIKQDEPDVIKEYTDFGGEEDLDKEVGFKTTSSGVESMERDVFGGF